MGGKQPCLSFQFAPIDNLLLHNTQNLLLALLLDSFSLGLSGVFKNALCRRCSCMSLTGIDTFLSKKTTTSGYRQTGTEHSVDPWQLDPSPLIDTNSLAYSKHLQGFLQNRIYKTVLCVVCLIVTRVTPALEQEENIATSPHFSPENTVVVSQHRSKDAVERFPQ